MLVALADAFKGVVVKKLEAEHPNLYLYGLADLEFKESVVVHEVELVLRVFALGNVRDLVDEEDSIWHSGFSAVRLLVVVCQIGSIGDDFEVLLLVATQEAFGRFLDGAFQDDRHLK